MKLHLQILIYHRVLEEISWEILVLTLLVMLSLVMLKLWLVSPYSLFVQLDMITPAIEKATTNLSTVKNNLLFRPVDKCIILPYSQLLNLAPMYALAILTHLEALDKESKLLTLDFHHFKSVWGFQFPSKLVLASERTKTTDVVRYLYFN